ncbi:AT-rich interactive domain-containing protein 5A isoform X2 [Pelodiscus sinensis]|uniref:AT-rich interaction domain 5A n=1 Tax=Pelodiscus sinensis TaxID=13735 RepID=K7G6B2_PELSI|nr:AT-rich interactive domain-containing protein 5A [Pelodiscus sinensis]XP_025043471.1 AT-rich interactive domain-containing protein 5A [Pelodiscus sinensis]|eukprot:XP_006129008.1 AT-rich interactive domain-containing protein 5A [Pelodiscus sinensis]
MTSTMEAIEPGPVEESNALKPEPEGSQSTVDSLDQLDSPAPKSDSSSEVEQKRLVEEMENEQETSREKEEEQAFLVNLYKFMKDRHTPIERVPHLGFKQINLWKIYKAVEKLGAYELVTGRRLWKNVYDELGGSPGSTSAATCTRRHYERLVLPYVRHLKGEDDKPLPPTKPRKQYKVSREPRGEQGEDTAEKSKRVKKEKSGDQVLPEKVKPDASVTPKWSVEDVTDAPKQNQLGDRVERLPISNTRDLAKSPPSTSCHSNCRAHGCSEAYKRLFSSFCFKGNHGIMSPLAKKKLLAQVSKAESLHYHERHLSHCPEGKKSRSAGLPCPSPELESNRPSVIHQCKEGRSPVPEGDDHSNPAQACHLPNRGEGVLCPKGSRSPRGSQIFPRTDSRSSGRHLLPAPAIFTGRFHAYRSEVLKPVSCHPLRGPMEYFPGYRDFQETPSACHQPGQDTQPANPPRKRQEDTEGCMDQPEDLRSKVSQAPPSLSGDSPRPSAFYKSSSVGSRGSPFASVKACWVPPLPSFTKASPQLPKNSGLIQPVPQSQLSSPALGHGLRSKRSLEEEGFVHGKKLKAVSPLVKGVEPKDKCGESPSLQQGLAKPRAVVPNPSFPAPLASTAGQDSYKGTMLRFPVNFGTSTDHLKGQSSPLIPSLSVSPFIIPAFPSHLLAASTQPSDLCRPLATSLVHYPTSYDSSLRHRLYPVSTWHNQPTYTPHHVNTFHRNTKL